MREHALPLFLIGVIASYLVADPFMADAESSSAGRWLFSALVIGVVVVASGLHAVRPVAGSEQSDRPRIAAAAGLLLLGLSESLASTSAGSSAGSAALPAVVHVTGSVAVGAACVSTALRTQGNRSQVRALALDAAGAWVLVAALSTPFIAPRLLTEGPGYLASSPTLACGAASAALAAALAAGSAIRPGWRHPVLLLILACALTWAAGLIRLATWTAPPGALPTAVALAALPIFAVAARHLPHAMTEDPRVQDHWPVMLPLTGAIAAVVGEVATSTLDLPPGLHVVLPGLGLLCLCLTAWRVRAASSAPAHDAGTSTSVAPGRDPLTGLADRHTLRGHIADAPGPVTLLAVDLEGLRRINEEVGRDLGDCVLTLVGVRLSALAGPGGIAARVDGDDFAVVLHSAVTGDPALMAAEVQRVVQRPLIVGDRRFHLGANVGVVTGRRDTLREHQDPAESWVDAVLRCSDITLGLAQARKSGLAVHDEGSCRTGAADQVLELVADLHTALTTCTGLLIHLQPQHRLDRNNRFSSASLSGCEALLRWDHPTRGLLGPDVVLRAARHSQLGRALTDRVLDLALAAAATWWHTRQLPVAVNLTTEDLEDPTFPTVVSTALHRYGLPGRALSVEVVEDSLMVDPEQSTRTLGALRALGMRVAIDDYGTGYSSLAWLHRLPVDEVKLDRSLTDGLADDPAATAIVRHSIRLAHDLNLAVLAEGVERPQDLALLRELGCAAVQGFLTGRPQPLSQWRSMLAGSPPTKTVPGRDARRS